MQPRFVAILTVLAIGPAAPPLSATVSHDGHHARIALADAGAWSAHIPSFTRQTGLACNVCHSTFPQLTPFGRLFKANGYTLTGKEVVEAAGGGSLKIDLIPPVSTMVVAGVTSLKTGPAGFQNQNAAFPQELSVFLGEEITPRLGTFLQLTYDGADGSIAMDNAEIRFADEVQFGGKPMIFGATLNNNPTMQDLWNSTPAWGFPFTSSGVAPGPAAAPLIDDGLAQQVAGLGLYGLWNSLVYGEMTLYRSAPLGAPNPPDATSEATINGLTPYWRFALQHDRGPQSFMVGTYGIVARLFPTGVTGPTDKFTDVALDAQYQYRTFGGSLVAHATWIHEKQDLAASLANGDAANASNTLKTLRVDAGYHHTSAKLGVTLSYFNTTGDIDQVLYPADPLTGSASGSPNANGEIAQLEFMPWLNARFGVQYVMYNKFNGAGNNYDGAGRNASDNNTLYVFTWLAF